MMSDHFNWHSLEKWAHFSFSFGEIWICSGCVQRKVFCPALQSSKRQDKYNKHWTGGSLGVKRKCSDLLSKCCFFKGLKRGKPLPSWFFVYFWKGQYLRHVILNPGCCEILRYLTYKKNQQILTYEGEMPAIQCIELKLKWVWWRPFIWLPEVLWQKLPGQPLTKQLALTFQTLQLYPENNKAAVWYLLKPYADGMRHWSMSTVSQQKCTGKYHLHFQRTP